MPIVLKSGGMALKSGGIAICDPVSESDCCNPTTANCCDGVCGYGTNEDNGVSADGTVTATIEGLTAVLTGPLAIPGVSAGNVNCRRRSSAGQQRETDGPAETLAVAREAVVNISETGGGSFDQRVTMGVSANRAGNQLEVYAEILGDGTQVVDVNFNGTPLSTSSVTLTPVTGPGGCVIGARLQVVGLTHTGVGLSWALDADWTVQMIDVYACESVGP